MATRVCINVPALADTEHDSLREDAAAGALRRRVLLRAHARALCRRGIVRASAFDFDRFLTSVRHSKSSYFHRLGALVAAVMLVAPAHVAANGSDIPSEIVVQAFLKQEGNRARLAVRVPLALLQVAALPRRGPGYLDLARVDDKLAEAAQSTGRQIEISDDGTPLIPMVRASRVSLLSDRAFASYDAALALLEGPKLPADTDMFWNQGYFDVTLDYPLHGPDANLSIRSSIAPELERRVKLRLTFLPAGGPPRAYEIVSGSGWIPLDPGLVEAMWLSFKRGFVDAFAFDRLTFLVCLIAPFRSVRSLLAVIVVMAGMQALTMTASGAHWLADARWVQSFADVGLAVAILLLAIGNLGAPSLRRRWFVAAVVAALGGFAIGPLFAESWQFAGAHSVVAAFAYNGGIIAGAVIILLVALMVLRALFALVLGESLGVIVLSALVALIAWTWLLDGLHRLQQAADGGVSSASVIAIARWLLPALLVGGAAYFLPRSFGGERVQSLRDALFSRR
jgi:hypothetical protein